MQWNILLWIVANSFLQFFLCFISNISKAAIRFGLSNAAVSSIANATLIDIGIITNDEENKMFQNIISECKIQYGKEKVRKMALEKYVIDTELKCLGLDSKISPTRTLINQHSNRLELQDTNTLIQIPKNRIVVFS